MTLREKHLEAIDCDFRDDWESGSNSCTDDTANGHGILPTWVHACVSHCRDGKEAKDHTDETAEEGAYDVVRSFLSLSLSLDQSHCFTSRLPAHDSGRVILPVVRVNAGTRSVVQQNLDKTIEIVRFSPISCVFIRKGDSEAQPRFGQAQPRFVRES